MSQMWKQNKLKPLAAAALLLACGLTAAQDLAPAGDMPESAANAEQSDKPASAPRARTEVRTEARGETRIRINGEEFNFPHAEAFVQGHMGEAFASAFNPMANRTVKNAPYSAEVISEQTQVLADGNTITNRNSSMSYRDAAGRTRQEVRDPKGELKLINIYDAVDGTRFLVTPGSKSVQKFVADKEFAARIEAAREKAEQARQKAEERAKEARERNGNRSVTTERGPNGEEVTTIRTEKVGKDGKVEKREETVVRVVRVGDEADGQRRQITVHVPAVPPAPPAPPAAPVAPMAPMAPVAPVPPPAALGDLMRLPAINNAFGDRQWRKNATTTDLGSKDFEGVKATGKRTAYTIPAGEVGNKNPITVSTETWYSPDLQLTVYSKYSDPRSGESVYRLANLKRTEQPASLFAAPEGYAVKETRLPHFESKMDSKMSDKMNDKMADKEAKAAAKAEAKAAK